MLACSTSFYINPMALFSLEGLLKGVSPSAEYYVEASQPITCPERFEH